MQQAQLPRHFRLCALGLAEAAATDQQVVGVANQFVLVFYERVVEGSEIQIGQHRRQRTALGHAAPRGEPAVTRAAAGAEEVGNEFDQGFSDA